MSLSCVIKVDSVSDLSEARYASGMGVSYLGVRLMSGDGALVSHAEMASWVHGPEWVGEWASESEAGLAEAVAAYGVSGVEVRHTGLASSISADKARFIRLDVSGAKVLPGVLPTGHAHSKGYVILDGGLSDYRRLQGAIKAYAQQGGLVLLSWDSNPTALPEALTWGIAGFTLQGTSNEQAGKSHYEGLAEVLEALTLDE